MSTFFNRILLGLILHISLITHIKAQNAVEPLPENSIFKEAQTKLWLNTYGNIRISKKLFWIAQTHFRFQETDDVPFMGQIAQIYNRHALGYIFNETTNFALGSVLRFNANTSNQDDNTLVPEWRIWHQYQFASKLGRAVMYNRFRIEHRWSKGFGKEDEFIFRNRWRYMFRFKIPINKPEITSNVFYVGPEAELIMQSGKPVVASPLEDLRLHTNFGYIFSPQITLASGLMYNMGQTLENGGVWKQGWTIRLHVYFSPDFRKTRSKLPQVHFRD